MKFKNLAVFFSLVLIFSIFNMGFVPAPSHPTYICEDGKVYDYINGDGCSTLDSIWEFTEPPKFYEDGFFHKVKIAFSSQETKSNLAAVLTAKQISQLEQALERGDYAEAQKASEDIRRTLGDSGRYLEEFGGKDIVNSEEFYKGSGVFNDFLYTKRMYVQDIEEISKIKSEILSKVDSGEITQEEADKILGNFDGDGEIIFKLDQKESNFINDVSEQSGKTELEIRYDIYHEDEETGMQEYYKNFDSADYAATMAKLDALKEQIDNSDREYSREAENLFDEAKLRAQLAQTELENEHYSEGYNEFYRSQYILNNLENYVDGGERAFSQIDREIVIGPAELTKEIVEKNNQIIRDYELAQNMLLEKYPEEKNSLDSSYVVAQDVVALSEQMDKIENTELTKLEESGKTEEEAKEIIEGKKVEEYYYNYGGKYFPPGYVHVLTDDETREINYDYGGGFVKRYDYSDASYDTDYRFGDNGYSWTTWTGEKYSTPHPVDYEPERVKRGDEVFKTDVETEDGIYNYEYYSTGYKYTAPDGTEKEIVYSDTADKMQFTGGAFVDYEPTGYVVTYKGEAQVWQGNPVFDNYINLADGKVFVPEVSPQEDAIYDAEKKVYEYDYGGVNWEFDPATKVLANEVTKQSIPTVAPDAPIGHEEEAELKTEDGTEWKYDDSNFKWHWKGSDGIEGDYIPAPNNYYSYDDDSKEYSDVEGNSYINSVEYADEKWTMQGETWISEGKTTYNPKTGDVYVLVGDAIVLASELENTNSRNYNYGRKYDSSGAELNKYTYYTGTYAWDPRTNSYGFYNEVGLMNYDPANPPKHELKDAEGKVITTWIQDRDGRWRVEGSTKDTGYFGYERYSSLAEVGRSVVGDDGKKYYVDSKLGWATVDENGNSYAVAPPTVGGKQQPSSAMRTGTPGGDYARGYSGYYGGYYDSTTGNYVGAIGCSGGCYGDYGYGSNYYGGTYNSGFGHVQQSDGTWRPATSWEEVETARTVGTYSAPGTSAVGIYGSGNYYGGGSTPGTPIGTNYQYTDPTSGKTTTYTKTEAGDWKSSDGVSVGTPPGYSTGSYSTSGPTAYRPGYGDYSAEYDYSAGGYYSNGAWVSTPSTNYGGNYASYYGGYSGSGAEVGRTTTYNGQVYTVTADKGWTDALGNAVAPPPGQPSSATGSYSGGYTGGYYSGGTWVSSGGYTGGGGYDASGNYVGGSYGSYDASGNYAPSGSYMTGGSYATGPNSGTASGTYSGAYTVGGGTYDSATGTYSYGSYTYSGGTYDATTGSYSGSTSPIGSGSSYYSGGTYTGGGGYDSSGNYVGGEYGGYSSSGTYTGGESYTSSGGDTSTSSSTSTSTSSTSTSSDSSTSSGGDSGGTSSGGTTGAVISGFDSAPTGNWLRNFWKSLFN